MKRYIVNFKKVTTREEMYALLEKKLPLPEYFGCNLDALHDVLTEAGYTLEVRSIGHLRDVLGDYADTFCKVIGDVEKDSTDGRFRAVIKE